MNRIQHKKWIDTLGIGLFILTLLYMCGLTSNKDEIEIEQNVVTEDKIQQERICRGRFPQRNGNDM